MGTRDRNKAPGQDSSNRISLVDRQIGRRIRITRMNRGLTQEQLAEATELSASYVSYLECGSKQASLPALIRIADVLETTVDQLLGLSRSASGKYPAFPEAQAFLEDCSDLERHIVFEVAIGVRRAIREHEEWTRGSSSG
jgi:transcriptional regulator with XRE-family HTH domain